MAKKKPKPKAKKKDLVAKGAKTHSEWAASKSEIWMNCPGHVNAFRQIPPELRQKSGVEANRGTAAHHILELCLDNDKDAEEYRDERVYVTEEGECFLNKPCSSIKIQHDFIVDTDMIEAVQVCIDYVRSRITEMGEGTEMKLEVQCVPFADRPGMYGTGDVRLSSWDELEIIDYKHGRSTFVPIEGNTQLRYYGLGAAREEDFHHKKVTITIVQPRCPQGGEVIRSETLTMKELRAWEKTLRKALENSEKKDAPLIPGDHCTWCEVKNHGSGCPALNKATSKALSTDFAEIDLDEELPVIHIPDDPEEIARYMRLEPMIKAFLDGIRKNAYELARKGKLPDFKIVAAKSNRKLKEDVTEKDVLKTMKKYGVDKDECYAPKKLKSIAQLEKLVPAKKRGELNKKLSFKPVGSPKIVPADDPREAIPMGAKFDFLDVEDD